MGTTLGSTGITFNDATVQTTAAAVASVGGNTGAITNAQIAASATAGYGYTPANGSNYVAKDANTAIGATFATIIATGGNTPIYSVGQTVANIKFAAYGIVGLPGAYNYATLAGTWRILQITTWVNNETYYNIYVAQRIA